VGRQWCSESQGLLLAAAWGRLTSPLDRRAAVSAALFAARGACGAQGSIAALACVSSPLACLPAHDHGVINSNANQQAQFIKRKHQLMRKAMELAVLCNAQVGIVIFDDKNKVTQFSTTDMDMILENYGNAVMEPHERYSPQDVSCLTAGFLR